MRALFWITLVLLQFWAVAVIGNTISSAAASVATLLTTCMILSLASWGIEHWRKQCSTVLDLVDQLETELTHKNAENALLDSQLTRLRQDLRNAEQTAAVAHTQLIRATDTQTGDTVSLLSANMTKPAARECIETIAEFKQILTEQLRGDRPRRRQRYSVRDIYRILPAAVLIFARRYQARAAKYGYSTSLEAEESLPTPPIDEPDYDQPLRPLEFDD